MNQIHLPPIALIVFSNDLDGYLSNIETERKIIEEALEHYDDTNRLKVITRSSVTIKELFRLFNRYKGRIALFHFAGHASGQGLQLNDEILNAETGRAEGIASLFQREVEEGLLQLVFLNGCSTLAQVEGLQAAKVPSIIATQCAINDTKAVSFAQQFYRDLANSDSATPFNSPATSVKQAFKTALSFLKTSEEITIEKATKGLKLRRNKKSDEAPWMFFSENSDWTLSTETAAEHKIFNELLTKRLMEALQNHSAPAKKFLQVVRQKAPDWESNKRISDKAKDIIAYSFVGVIGIQLRKIMAIGKENTTDAKFKIYIEYCILTAEEALKLICITLISKLWDEQKQQKRNFTEEQNQVLKQFFEDVFNKDLKAYGVLLKTLFDIFSTHQLPYPMSELNDFQHLLAANSDFENAITKLHSISEQLEKNKYSLSDCFTAERQLTIILEKLAFLSNYKMVSIKNISYEEVRDQAPRYLHRFAALGIDSKFNVNSERVNYSDLPVMTDAILLFKGRYQDSINLFPFIIDYNALTFENGAKICFYYSRKFEDNSLNFRFLEDNTIQNIEYQATLENHPNINEIMIDNEKRKAVKLDSVFLQFKAAQENILSSSSHAEEDVLSELDDLDSFLDDF